MREHNFQICTWRKDNRADRVLWECRKCDTIVSIKKGVGIMEVNRFMANQLLCQDPLVVPSDDVVDNRTTILRKPTKKILLN